MEDIKNVKIGANNANSIMFDKYYAVPSDFKFDFRNWIINKEAGHDIEVTNNRIIIKKFKPNVCIIHSEDVVGSQNHAICDYCQDIYFTVKNISAYYDIFKYIQHFPNSHGAGNDTPKFYGLCPYPMTTDNNFMQEHMYTWEACWDSADTRYTLSVADFPDFRLDGNSHGVYGIINDCQNRLIFPEQIYDFNTWGRNPNNTVTWRFGLALCTGLIQSFSDNRWSFENSAVLNGNKVTITKRLDGSSNAKHVFRYTTIRACKIIVSGLQEGDTLTYANANSVLGAGTSITTNGKHDLIEFGNGSQGVAFKLYGNTEINSPVTIELINDSYPNGIIDISSAPIIIEVQPTKGVNVTNIESYDAYVGNTHVYHKNKTFENCWIKHGIVKPYGFAYSSDKFNKSKYIEWISSNKFIIRNIDVEGINIYTNKFYFEENYNSIKFSALSVAVINKPDNVNISFKRAIVDSVNDNENSVDINLINGVNKIPTYEKIIYKNSNASKVEVTECQLIINGEAKNINCIIEFNFIYTDSTIFLASTNMWSNIVSNIEIPIIDDIEKYIPYTKFQIRPSNVEVWDRIKKWYENNDCFTGNFQNGKVFANSSGLKDITIRLVDYQYLPSDDNFNESDIETITFVKQYPNACISAPQHLLRSAFKLKTINLVFKENIPENKKYICGANTIVDGMSCNIETYPERLINWSVYRSNIRENTIWCTLFHYCFNNNSKLIRVPDYPGVEDENTIVCANTIKNSFYNCSSLTYVGPIIDLSVCFPNKSMNAFYNCINLTSIKIKNLNHGDWSFDGKTRNGYCNGNIPKLNFTSIEYLFKNLSNLTTHNPKKHEDKIENSFKNWRSEYFTSNIDKHDWEYCMSFITTFRCRKRYALAKAPFIVSTNHIFTNMSINISGLKENEFVYFIREGDVDGIQYGNGRHVLSNNNSIYIGFKLVGDNLEETNEVLISIENGLDYTNPKVISANLYCPEEWRDKITDTMVTNANTKGWTIYIGNVVKTV